jgi:Mor family transcriptional regulator
MTEYTKQINDLRKIIELAESAIAALGGSKSGAPKRRKKRRTSEEATAFRAMLKAERDKGVPVYDLAKKHKVTMSYIYQIK